MARACKFALVGNASVLIGGTLVKTWKFLLLLLLFGTQAQALESVRFQTDRDQVSLVSNQDHIGPDGEITIGLRVHTAPGWNIYWRNPGDAGSAPRVDLSLPAGVQATGILWPAPEMLPESGITIYGYRGDVVLPIKLTHAGAGDLAITAKAEWLVCNNLCVPEEHDFSLTIPAGPKDRSSEAGLIESWLARVPVASPFAAVIAPDGTLMISGSGLSRETVHDAWFFPEKWGPIEISAPETLTVEPGRLMMALKPGGGFKPTQHLAGVLALHDPKGGESDLVIDAVPGAVPVSAGLGWSLVLYAFLGGLILNLMPCVFPILAMKAVALARMSGASRAHVRHEAGFYTLGVVVSFAALGGLLGLARALGGNQGWGFQFQSPVFVALMAALMLAVALNLAGMFEFNARFWLPRQGGAAGSFLTGLLAVLLATPCTAPFMAVAVAGALQAPAAQAALIFVAMGLGMAGPYALLAVAPGLARFLPRPGAWMGWLRRGLAVPMAAAMGWLLWVEYQQVTRLGFQFALILLLWVALGLYALRRFQAGGSGRNLAISTVAALVFILISTGEIDAHRVSAISPDDGVRFTPARLASLRAAGTPVFVDMTAAWCVTCLVNERVALEPNAVKQAFSMHQVAYLKGDWTNQDPDITQYLHEFGRDGVPLYVYYGAGQAPPVVLPQILSANEVVKVVDGK